MIDSKKFKNPFPGLRPFETDEYRLFFGREGQSDALIARLQSSRLLAVVGTSGSGKSSLVRAGLLPALRGGMMAGAGSGWRISIMRPGSDPFSNLARALAEKGVMPEAGGGLPEAEARAVIEATLRRGSLGLVDAARHARLAENEKLLVVVDQFEELFRFRAARATTSTGDDASAFVKLLLEAAQQRELSLYVVLTMRSDFLGDCAQFQGLPEAINDGQYLIPRMTRDERRIAITGPIGVARGRVAEPLVSRLLNDVGDNPDQLPILQHAMMRTWDYWAAHRRNSEPLGLEHYQAIGTMAEALSRHADEAYDILDERSRRVAELLFKSLTERGADNREIRRPTRISEICDIVGAGVEDVGAVLEVFRYEGCSFLMPPEGVPLTPDTVIDISHESLIRNWDRLQKWVDEEAQSSRIYRRLAEAAVLHREGSEGLLQNPALQIALDWRDQSRPNAAWARRYNPEFAEAMKFLDASKEAKEAEIAEKERQREELLARERRELEMARDFAEKQARSARRLRWAAVAMAVLFVFALGGAGYAFNMKQRAEASQGEANRQKSIATELLEKEKVITQQLLGEQAAKEDALEDARTKAGIARDEAEKAQKEEERADKQAGIAKQRAIQAEEAAAREKAKAMQLQEAMDRNDLVRRGLEEFQRGDLNDALNAFELLTNRLIDQRPGANSRGGGQGLTSEQAQQLAVQHGWAHSNTGSTRLKMGDSSAAVVAFEQARNILEESLKDDTDDPILLDTYSGLADAYHGVGLGFRDEPAKRDENYRKSEEFYQSALKLQKEHMVEKKLSEQVLAPRYANLARLYVDTARFDKAEEHFKLAVKLLRMGKESRDLNSNERSALAAALRELAEFYQGREGCYDEAIEVLNDMIAVQEDVPFSELIQQGQEIANSYNDLGQIHTAIGDEARREAAMHDPGKVEGEAAKEAETAKSKAAEEKAARHTRNAADALRMASLLERTAFKLRAMRKGQVTPEDSAVVIDLTTDLDELGDAYAKLGKLAHAEKIYLEALGYRNTNNEQWKSYDKLATFYREIKKDSAKAEEYKNLLNGAIKGNADVLLELGSLHSDDAYDPEKAFEAENYYKDALAIYKRQSNWDQENTVLYRLSKLYEKQKRVTEREQVRKDRIDTMAGYFKQLEVKADPPPQNPVKLVSEYLYAINAVAYKNKNDAEAEANYRRALGAYDYVKGNIDDKKVLEFYANTLKDYVKLLVDKLNKHAEAKKVAEQEKAVRDKLKKLP